MNVLRLLIPLLLLLSFSGMPPSLAGSPQGQKLKYYDIYLSGDRVCEKCVWRLLPGPNDKSQLVELTNREGVSGIYPATEIIGVDTDPLMRKLFLKGLAGMGLAGEIIVPQAFENVKEHTCKYCGER